MHQAVEAERKVEAKQQEARTEAKKEKAKAQAKIAEIQAEEHHEEEKAKAKHEEAEAEVKLEHEKAKGRAKVAAAKEKAKVKAKQHVTKHERMRREAHPDPPAPEPPKPSEPPFEPDIDSETKKSPPEVENIHLPISRLRPEEYPIGMFEPKVDEVVTKERQDDNVDIEVEIPEIEGAVTQHQPESEIVPGEPIEDIEVPTVEVEEGYELPAGAVLKADETLVVPAVVNVVAPPYTRETTANIPSGPPYTQETIADVHEHHFNPEPIIIQPKMDRARRGNASNVIKQLLNFKRKSAEEQESSGPKPLELMQKAKIGSILQDAIWNK